MLIFILAACSQIEDEGMKQSPLGLLNLTQEEFMSIAYDNPKELDTD